MNAQALLRLMKQQRLAVMASVTDAGTPQAAIVGIAVSDRFEVVFDTIETTRKAQNLRRNPRVAMVIGGWSPEDERTVQYEGVVDIPQGQELERIKAVYFEAYPEGRGRAGWRDITYLRARPTWIRYTDFNLDPVEVVEFSARALAVVLES